MKELRMDELQEVNGGAGEVKGGIIGWVIGKALDWAVANPPKNYGPNYGSTSRLL